MGLKAVPGGRPSAAITRRSTQADVAWRDTRHTETSPKAIPMGGWRHMFRCSYPTCLVRQRFGSIDFEAGAATKTPAAWSEGKRWRAVKPPFRPYKSIAILHPAKCKPAETLVQVIFFTIAYIDRFNSNSPS